MHVVVIGGGIGGLCLAHGLKKAGASVAVYERHLARAPRGESYSIQINPHGNRALYDCLPADLWAAYIATMGAPVTGIRFVTEQLNPLAGVDWPAAADPVQRDCRVSRAKLLQILRTGLDDELHFGKTFERFERADAQVVARFHDGSTVIGDILVGADGVGSRVRKQLLPQVRVHNLDSVGIGGKCTQRLPPPLVERMHIVLPPAGCGMFITSFTRTSAGAQLEGDSSLLARDLEDHVFWALIARPAKLGLTDFRPADGARVKSLALNLTQAWHPILQQLVGDTDPSTVVAIPLQSGDLPGPWATTRVTLLGDAIHTMPPLQGLGGNTALRDAHLLCSQLVQVGRDQAGVIPAVSSYESAMRGYGATAMRASLRQTDSFVSDNRVAREAFKVVLRTASALPPLKRRLFRPPAA